MSYRVIADHGRSMTFLIGDGVLPSNEGRGYVLRLILRRAARHGRMLGFTEPFLAEVAKVVIEIMGDHYTELRQRQDFILTTIEQEEARFGQTLTNGVAILEELIAELKRRGENVIPGAEAFRLYDTHGFPLDLTQDMARENDMIVDLAGYQAAMADQKERARSAAQFGQGSVEGAQTYSDLLQTLRRTGHTGPAGVTHEYMSDAPQQTRVIALLKEGAAVPSVNAGDAVEVVLAATNFYVESGGQVSDTGLIRAVDSEAAPWEIQVMDVRRPVPGLIVHMGEVKSGSPSVGNEALTVVDQARRTDIRRNHTATHLLDHQLRELLGKHVQQAGSVVAPDRLRFDFTHPTALSQEQLDEIERSINVAILADSPVHDQQTTYREAVTGGAIALFTEKYGDEVRVVKIGEHGDEYSKELCGGTHVEHTGQVGLFRIVSEESVGAGVRRIEAVTGRPALELVQRNLNLLSRVAEALRVPASEVEGAIETLRDELRSAEKELARLRAQATLDRTARLAEDAQHVDGIAVVAAVVPDADADTLREVSDRLRGELGTAVVVLATVSDGKPQLIAAATDDAVARGIHAGELVKTVARSIGGGGGGKATLGQAGGRDAEKLAAALASVPGLVEKQLAG
jgi:alanyl-tRNA synthetase